jgi:transposase InsO family protein
LPAFPGLGLKAYLIRERNVAASLVNQYAPFYLWASIDGRARFLWGGAAPTPDRKWIADFAYIWTAEGWRYVAAVLGR